MEIVTQYSLWWMLAVVVLATAFSLLLYFRNPREDFPRWLNIVLGLFRFSVLLLIGFMLLGPMLKSRKTEVQKPVILFLQDNSESIVLTADSAFYRSDYPKQIRELLSDISAGYELKRFSFSDKLNPATDFDFSGKTTNLSSAMKSVYDQYAHLNVGAMIIATDGIYNQGSNPYYLSQKMKFPVYFIALGDTVIKSDLIIQRQAYNRTVFKGNSFPIEVEVLLRKARGKTTELQLLHKGRVVERKKITIKSDNQKERIRFYPVASEAGLQEYRLRLKTIEDEQNTHNNFARLFVNVIDTRQKILILYESPHPDISAIKSALESKETYDVEVASYQKFSASLKPYNLVIFHQLPGASRNSTRYLTEAKKLRKPFLLILGSKTFLPSLNNLHLGIEIQSRGMSMNSVLPVYNKDFGAFNISGELQNTIATFPPLQAPYGKYGVSKAMQTLLQQQIGSVKTKIPLIAVGNLSGWRTGFIAGEGIWRWRLNDYLRNDNHRQFDELIGKLVRYLSLLKEQSEFDLEVKKQFEEGEEVRFDAVLYNASYEPVTTDDIELKIRDENGKEYPFVFSKRDSSYYLNAGSFAPGIYRYEAVVKNKANRLRRKGSFTVSAIGKEALQLTADHHLLRMIAAEHQARVFSPEQMRELPAELQKRDDIVSVEYSRLKYSDLIDIRWLLVLLVFLLAIEWFVRKQSGSY
jgi:hypothetical protein